MEDSHYSENIIGCDITLKLTINKLHGCTWGLSVLSFNLTDTDSELIWNRLTAKEQAQFNQMMKDGRLGNLVEVWTPWWDVKVRELLNLKSLRHLTWHNIIKIINFKVGLSDVQFFIKLNVIILLINVKQCVGVDIRCQIYTSTNMTMFYVEECFLLSILMALIFCFYFRKSRSGMLTVKNQMIRHRMC